MIIDMQPYSTWSTVRCDRCDEIVCRKCEWTGPNLCGECRDEVKPASPPDPAHCCQP